MNVVRLPFQYRKAGIIPITVISVSVDKVELNRNWLKTLSLCVCACVCVCPLDGVVLTMRPRERLAVC